MSLKSETIFSITQGSIFILSEYKDGRFFITDLETLTTKEYLAGDYFRDVIVITKE